MKKIMFNDKYGLTKAVLNGEKSQTRRVINLKEGESVKVVALDNGCFMSYVEKDGNPTAYVGALEMPNFVRPLEPKYFIGEVVAVAQAYKDIPSIANINFIDVDWDRVLKHKPSGKWGFASKLPGWKNKMFVRTDQMPHHIRITNIRVEKLQDISNDDCLAEGVGALNEKWYFVKGIKLRHITIRHKDIDGKWHPFKWQVYETPRAAYADLIDKVSGKGTWESNPWVFVYDFEKED